MKSIWFTMEEEAKNFDDLHKVGWEATAHDAGKGGELCPVV